MLPKKSPGRPRKLKDEELAIIHNLVKENNDWTLEEYQSSLEKETGGQPFDNR